MGKGTGCIQPTLSLLQPGGVTLVQRLANGIFRFTNCFLGFPLELFGLPFGTICIVIGQAALGFLKPTLDFLHFAINSIFVHRSSLTGW